MELDGPDTGAANARQGMAARRREEFRHNWPLVLTGFVAVGTGAWSVPIYLLGPVSKPLQLAFGWSASGIAEAAAALGVGTTLGTPLLGLLADRSDRTLLALGSILVIAACFVTLALNDGALWRFQLAFFLMGFLGAGSGGTIFLRALGDGFVRARGLAVGMVLSGSGVAAFLTPLLAQALLESYGLRATFLAFASVNVLVTTPIVLFGLRRRTTSAHRSGATAALPEGVTRQAALRDGRFYILLLSIVLFGLFVAGVIVSIVPMLIDGGMTARRAAGTASSLGVSIIVGRLTVGSLLDRFRPALVSAAVFCIGAAGAFLFLAAGVGAAVVTVPAFGLLLGAEVDVLSFLTLRFFGSRHYGAIYGLLFAGYSGPSMLSPLIAAALVARGGYALLFAFAGSAFLISGLLMLTLRDPPKADRRRTYG